MDGPIRPNLGVESWIDQIRLDNGPIFANLNCAMSVKAFLAWLLNFCENHLVWVLLAGLGVFVFVFLILDAHLHKKKRPRHRIDK